MARRKPKTELEVDKLIIFVLITIISILALWALSFHIVEGRTYFNSLYFTIATFSTIGYGDVVPVTFLGKVFVMIYAFLWVPLFVAITTLIMERRFQRFVHKHFTHHTKLMQQREKKLQEKLAETVETVESEAKITQKQERKIKKLEKEIKTSEQEIEQELKVTEKKLTKKLTQEDASSKKTKKSSSWFWKKLFKKGGE